ncbi:uncharacterized protein [Clytia hemisphaerica]
MLLFPWLSCLYVLILTGTAYGRQKQGELTLTDVRRDQKLVSKPIASIPVSKRSPVSCLTHCLARGGKAFNVNLEKGICEILGESKMDDDSLDMKEEKGWTYYGPKKRTPTEDYEDCYKVTSLINQKEHCCPKGRNGDRCQYQATCAHKYYGACHGTNDLEISTSRKKFLGSFSSTHDCFQQCKIHTSKSPDGAACESLETVNGHDCYVIPRGAKYGKATITHGAYYANCWVFTKCDAGNKTLSCHFVHREAVTGSGTTQYSLGVFNSRELCAHACYKKKRDDTQNINAVTYYGDTKACTCYSGVSSINAAIPTDPETVSCIINTESSKKDTSITVLAVDHSSPTVGKYFNFDRHIISLGDHEERRFLAYIPRTKTTAEVKVWGYVNGGSRGTAHGRFASSPANGQWRVGDKIVPIDLSRAFTVMSVDYRGLGINGKYFSFDRKDIGMENREELLFVAYVPRSSYTGLLVAWGNIAGSNGSAHGRFSHIDRQSAEGQWEIGDQIIPIGDLQYEGVSRKRPGHSCRRLKERNPEYRTGYYWIKTNVNNEKPYKRVYCEMDNEDGVGWMMIGHTKVKSTEDQPDVADSIVSNIQKGSGYQDRMNNMNAVYSFYDLMQFHTFNELTEIRFSCTKEWHGRKVNMAVKNEQFLRKVIGTGGSGIPCFCPRSENGNTPSMIRFLEGDTSLYNTNDCTKYSTSDTVVWGFCVFRTNFVHVNIYSVQRMECDDWSSDNGFTPQGEWWYYAR